jgi:hypothetical protein
MTLFRPIQTLCLTVAYILVTHDTKVFQAAEPCLVSFLQATP